jgi:hypothetical protein
VRTVLDLWHFNRRPLLVGGGLVLGLVVLLGAVALVLRLSGADAAGDTNRQSGHGAPPSAGRIPEQPGAPTSDEATPTDVASWDAIPPVTPAASAPYPAIAAAARRDPDAYARAFATELFTRDYRASTRDQLIGWAQYEDAPLQSPNYPRADWTKVLVNSLTDLTWDTATDTPIPAEGPWLAQRSAQARDAVSDMKVSPNAEWEQQVSNGYQPPDPLATVRDVSLTVTEHAELAGRDTVTRFAVRLSLQLGTSYRGDGFGVAATNDYVIRQTG